MRDSYGWARATTTVAYNVRTKLTPDEFDHVASE
jgi:hypothetical protein